MSAIENSPVKIHWLASFESAVYEALSQQLHPRLQLSMGPTLPDPTNFRILISGVPSREQLQACSHLTHLVIPWAGLPTSTRQLLADFPHLRVHNIHHNAGAVAEHTLALLLAVAKRLVPIDRTMRDNDWQPRYLDVEYRSAALEGRTALILGYGAIGRRVGRLCAALGMTVWGTKGSLTAPTQEEMAHLYPANALPELLPHAEAVIICLPLTPQTEGLLGAAELAQLPAGAIVVNIGRGAVINQRALYEALRDGHLFGAGLDVWYNYPTRGDVESRRQTPPADYPFHELDNVVMSPHRASNSTQTEGARLAHLAALLNPLADGRPMPNEIDLSKGY